MRTAAGQQDGDGLECLLVLGGELRLLGEFWESPTEERFRWREHFSNGQETGPRSYVHCLKYSGN